MANNWSKKMKNVPKSSQKIVKICLKRGYFILGKYEKFRKKIITGNLFCRW